MKIYTKTGDKGQTRLVDGSKISKADIRLRTYGEVDELNSFIGWTRCSLNITPLNLLSDSLKHIQNYLFNIGSYLACEKQETKKMLPHLSEKYISSLEEQIDKMNEEITPLREFILPGGAEPAGRLHLCRTVCRRAERNLVELLSHHPDEEDLQHSLRYLNRLSDFLFVASRYCNHHHQHDEPKWNKDET